MKSKFNYTMYLLHSPVRKFSKGWSNDSGFSYHTLTTNVDVSEVPTDNAATLNYGLCVYMYVCEA